MDKYTKIACATVGILLLGGTAAYAADQAAAAGEQLFKVDFRDLAQGLVTMLGAVAVAAGANLVRLLTKKVGIENEALNQVIYAKLHKAIDLGVQYGINSLEKAEWTQVSTKNAITAAALGYVVEHAPDLMKKVGMTEDKLKQVVEARMLAFDAAPGVWNK